MDPTPQEIQTATESVLFDLERFLIGQLIGARAQLLAARREGEGHPASFAANTQAAPSLVAEDPSPDESETASNPTLTESKE